MRRLCQTLQVHPSGYYAWLAEPKSARAKEDQRLLGLIKHAWLESGGVYGYRKIHDDLRELGESCGRHRVARLMRGEGLRSQTGYRRRPGYYGGKPTVTSPNRLERKFNVSEPNKVWVTDITYIRTYEGWLYLAVVLDLFSRQVIGWSMKPRMCSDLAIDALLMAVWDAVGGRKACTQRLGVSVACNQRTQAKGALFSGASCICGSCPSSPDKHSQPRPALSSSAPALGEVER